MSEHATHLNDVARWREPIFGGMLAPIVVLALLCIMLAVVLEAQRTSGGIGDSDRLCLIAGKVVDAATGEPVDGADVTLRASAGAPLFRGGASRVLTRQVVGLDGAFSASTVPAGRVLIRVLAHGYLPGVSGKTSPWDLGQYFECRPGEHLENVLIRLWRAGSISGTVRDQRGEPVVQAIVQAVRREYRGGQILWMSVGSDLIDPVLTDDRGMYRLGDLEPDDYVVMAAEGGRGRGSVPGTELGQATGFSGGSPSLREAQVLRLAPGEDLAGIDVPIGPSLESSRFQVSGAVLGPREVVTGLAMRLVADGNREGLASSRELTVSTTSDGLFRFSSVPAGRYLLEAWRFPDIGDDALHLGTRGLANIARFRGTAGPLPSPPTGPTWWAGVPITVIEDISGLTVRLQEAARIRGRIVFDGDGRAPAGEELMRLPVLPHPAFGRALGNIPGGRVEADGHFSTVGLPPGPYALQIEPVFMNLPWAEQWRPVSVTVGGQEVIGRPIELGASDVDVTVTFSNRVSTIAGTVNDPSPAPNDGTSPWSEARIILFAREPEMRGYGLPGTPHCVYEVFPDRFGRFTVSVWSACDFLIVAVANPPRLWMSPDYLESLVPLAIPAKVQAGQEGEVKLTLHR